MMPMIARFLSKAGGPHKHKWTFAEAAFPAEGGLVCECGERVKSAYGPPEKTHGSFTIAGADGPNCGWEDRQTLASRQEEQRQREEEAARWSSREGYEFRFMDKDNLSCKAEKAVWAKADLYKGGWPNRNPGDRPYQALVCCVCGWQIEQQIASDFFPGLGGGVVGVSEPYGHLESSAMRAWVMQMEHALSHGLRPDPRNSPWQQAERMRLELLGHTCAMLPTPVRFM